MQLMIGFFLAILIALLAWRSGSLSASGAWAAALTGGLIFGFGGLPWAILLLTFFISSSALSRAFSKRKASLAEKFSKGSRRDWGQVLANGGLGVLLAIGYSISPPARMAVAGIFRRHGGGECGYLVNRAGRAELHCASFDQHGAKSRARYLRGHHAHRHLCSPGWCSPGGDCSRVFHASLWLVFPPWDRHRCRPGWVIVRLAIGCYRASDLLVPNM